ncbi:MAG TPA: hypothetical protein VF474_13940 [Phenylobacterium sp.]
MAAVPAKADSVFDFLYVDARRIGLLLSQFGSDGILTELERSSETTSQHGGGFDVKVLKGDAREGAKSQLKRRFDPQWLLPLTFLDLAQEIIVRDPERAGIGQLVLVRGKLWVIDMSILKTMVDDPTIRKQLLKIGPTPKEGGNRQARKAAASTGQQTDPSTEMGMALVRILPHVIQARLDAGGDAAYWASLDPAGLVTEPADLFLKHGLQIAGEWVAIGVLDAVPEPGDPNTVENMIENMRNAEKLGAYAAGLAQMAPFVRPILGRPATSYGLTPLVIFREIVR